MINKIPHSGSFYRACILRSLRYFQIGNFCPLKFQYRIFFTVYVKLKKTITRLTDLFTVVSEQ